MENKYIKKQSDIHKMVYDTTSEIKNIVSDLELETRKRGLSSVKDLLKESYTGFKREYILDELYENFMQCVNQKISKEPWGKGRWSGNDTFEEFLSYTQKEASSRLEELEWKKQTQYPSYEGIIHLLPKMNNVPKGIGESLKIEDFEFYEEILKKTIEMIKDCLSNQKLLNSYLRDGMNRYQNYKKKIKGGNNE